MGRSTSSYDKFEPMEPLSSQVLIDLYAVAGELIIQWGMFESSLVATISMVFHDGGGKNISPQLPRTFSQRMDFLRTCFNQIPELAPYMEDARAIRSDAKELVIIRDFLAHGHLYGYDSKTGVYRFNKLDNDKEHLMHVQDTLDTTLKGLIGATVKIQGLFDRNHRINLGLAG